MSVPRPGFSHKAIPHQTRGLLSPCESSQPRSEIASTYDILDLPPTLLLCPTLVAAANTHALVMSAFEPSGHQRSFSYPTPTLPAFSNLYTQSPVPAPMYPPRKHPTMSNLAPIQPVTTTLPLLQRMDFSQYTTLYNNTPTPLGPQISHDRYQPNADGNDGTPLTQHATLPSTPTEPTSAPAHRSTFLDQFTNNFIAKQAPIQSVVSWQPEEAREFITPSRIGQRFAPMSIGNELPIEAFPRTHPYAQPEQHQPDYMGTMSGMMHFDTVDEDEVAREAHLAKTRKHVWWVVALPQSPAVD